MRNIADAAARVRSNTRDSTLSLHSRIGAFRDPITSPSSQWAAQAPVSAENHIHGSDQQSCSPDAPPVMITHHVPAVHLPPDYAKACLAKRSPALPVELRNGKFASLLWLLGLAAAKPPRSRLSAAGKPQTGWGTCAARKLDRVVHLPASPAWLAR